MKHLLALVLLSAALFAADSPSADVLNRWAGGKWIGEGAMLATEYSKPMKVGGVTTCAWSPDRVFMVCDQQVTVNEKADRMLSLYTYDSEKQAFHFFGLSPSGEHPRIGDVVISPDGGRWEYPYKAEISGKPVDFRTVNVFRDADHVDWWSEYSTDGGAKWIRTGAGKESRQR
jgi:hypothetical protein